MVTENAIADVGRANEVSAVTASSFLNLLILLLPHSLNQDHVEPFKLAKLSSF